MKIIIPPFIYRATTVLVLSISILINSSAFADSPELLQVTLSSTKGFPAISEDGSLVACIYDEARYDDTRSYLAKIIAVKDRKEVNIFKILDGQTLAPSDLKATHRAEETILELQDFLRSKKFRPMQALSPQQSRKLYFVFKEPIFYLYSNGLLLRKVKLPISKYVDPTCAIESAKKDCVRNILPEVAST